MLANVLACLLPPREVRTEFVHHVKLESSAWFGGVD